MDFDPIVTVDLFIANDLVCIKGTRRIIFGGKRFILPDIENKDSNSRSMSYVASSLPLICL